MLQRKEGEEWLFPLENTHCCFKVAAFWYYFGINIITLRKDSHEKTQWGDKQEENVVVKNWA